MSDLTWSLINYMYLITCNTMPCWFFHSSYWDLKTLFALHYHWKLNLPFGDAHLTVFWCSTFKMFWIFSVLLRSQCVYLKKLFEMFIFFPLEEWGWQEDTYKFEGVSARAGKEHSAVQTPKGKTGQSREWAPDHSWRVSTEWWMMAYHCLTWLDIQYKHNMEAHFCQ